MPRRIYEYPDVGHLELYNLISTIGAFILALGVAGDRGQRRCAASSAAPIAGPDPWKANTLEWFTDLAAAGQQLRRHPARALGRADEGHPPPGRAPRIRRRPRRRRARPRPSPRCVRDGPPRAPAPSRSPRAGRPRARSSSDYVALTKPKVQSLLLLHHGHDDGRRRRRRRWSSIAADLPGRLPVAPAARARSTTATTATSTRGWRAPPTGPCPPGASRRARR